MKLRIIFLFLMSLCMIGCDPVESDTNVQVADQQPIANFSGAVFDLDSRPLAGIIVRSGETPRVSRRVPDLSHAFVADPMFA